MADSGGSRPSPDRGWLESLGLHRKELRAWAMYDWANSAFATTIMASVFPIYYAQVAAATLPDVQRTAYFGYTTAIALLIVAVISPVLGAMADYMAAKKRFLAIFMGTGVVATALLYFVLRGEWLYASAVFIVANIGFSGGNVFYESLLPHVVESPREMDRVSTAGYAVGYLGGGLLLAVNLLWITFPEAFGISGPEHASRLAILSVPVWWLLFSIPLFRRVREPSRAVENPDELGMNPVRVGFGRVLETLREIRGHRQVFLFLLAFWLYNDGVGTIIKMGAVYGEEIGISQGHLIGVILVIQFVGMPFAFAFGALAERIGAQRGIYLALAIYTAIAVGGFFATRPLHFWVMGMGIATAQGGVQALSRSLFASIVPRTKSSEFFGFYSVSAKFAGILGPFSMAVVAQAMGSSRYGIVFLVVFFVAGALVLTRVDVEEGRRAARAEDREMVTLAG